MPDEIRVIVPTGDGACPVHTGCTYLFCGIALQLASGAVGDLVAPKVTPTKCIYIGRGPNDCHHAVNGNDEIREKAVVTEELACVKQRLPSLFARTPLCVHTRLNTIALKSATTSTMW